MVDPVAFTIRLGNWTRDIYWYGIIIACALLLGILLMMYHARRRGYKSEDMLDFAIVAVIFAVVCARIHYVLFCWEMYKDGPFWKVFAIWEGGLAIYGALIGGCIGMYIFSRWKKMRFLAIADLVVPSLILGQAIGRWGNFVNQEAFGYAITNPSLQFFPLAVFIRADGMYHMATFFYESMWNFMAFLFLFFYLRKPRKEGNAFFWYLLLYSTGRVFIEGLRTDSQMLLETGIRINQLIAALLIIFAATMLLFRKGGRIAEVYALEKTKKEKKPKMEEPLEPVADELKLMSDDVRDQHRETISDATEESSEPQEKDEVKEVTEQKDDNV